MKSWEHFEHEADVGVRGRGYSPEEAFEAAGLALTALVTDPARVRPEQEVVVSRSGSDPEILFVDWLNALIFEMSTRKMLFSDFHVRLSPDGLVGSAIGERIDRYRHEPAVEPKGATFTELRVGKEKEGWIAQCVVDV
jgi:SHS2 domain-containing protein